jgi:hypothetical protein
MRGQAIRGMSNEKRRLHAAELRKKIFEELKQRDLYVRDVIELTGLCKDTSYFYLKDLVMFGGAESFKEGHFVKFKFTGQEVTNFIKEAKGSGSNYHEILLGEKLIDVQNSLSKKPQTVLELCKIHNVAKCTMIRYLGILQKANGCKRKEVKQGKYNKAVSVYFVDDDVTHYEPKETALEHSDSRDGWKASAMPTNNAKLNAMMGYTEFKPPKGRHIKESMPDIPVSKPKYYISGCTLEMV